MAGIKKYLLKESFKKYFPNKFLEKPKKGFAVPVGDWLKTSFKDELISYVDKEFLHKQNIFRIDLITKLVFDHLQSRNDNTYRVWAFIVSKNGTKEKYFSRLCDYVY